MQPREAEAAAAPRADRTRSDRTERRVGERREEEQQAERRRTGGSWRRFLGRTAARFALIPLARSLACCSPRVCFCLSQSSLFLLFCSAALSASRLVGAGCSAAL